MQSENGLMIDVGQVREAVDKADVFVIGFSNLQERLLVDTRSNETQGPMVKLVEPLGSIQERLFWLGKERGAFGMPKAFTFLPWPHSVGFLEESGIWERIRGRVGAATDPAAAHQCDAALAELRELSRKVLLAAALGHNFVTLWPQPRQGDA
jgi:hypothetical protein